MTMGSQATFPTTQYPLSAFSALNLLRNYNQVLSPSGNNLVEVYHHFSCGTSVGKFAPEDHGQSDRFSFSPVTVHPFAPYAVSASPSVSDLKSRSSLLPPSQAVCYRRPRGEKKPIPDDQKDDRYYERRKRNNQAAKKSRDARKFREDQIALRATLLEHENAVLRAQVLTLRDETQSLRQYILKEKAHEKFIFGSPFHEAAKTDFEKKNGSPSLMEI